MLSGRILALDVGDRRIGLALSDALGLTAQPLFTLRRATQRADLKAIARFIRQHNVTTIVVGHPLHADGSPSRQSAKAQAFARALAEQHPALAHHLLDERLTTRDAHELLDSAARHTPRSAGPASRISRKAMRVSREKIIDQVAATLLLESFLAQQAGPSLLPEPEAGS